MAKDLSWPEKREQRRLAVLRGETEARRDSGFEWSEASVLRIAHHHAVEKAEAKVAKQERERGRTERQQKALKKVEADLKRLRADPRLADIFKDKP